MAHGAPDQDRGARRLRLGLAAALVGGAVLRVLLVVAAPRFGYAWDHFDIVGWGIVAGERGLTRVYSGSQEELPLLHGWIVQNGRPVTIQRRCVNLPNYPPYSQVVFWLQSWWLGAHDPGFVVNTAYTRLVTSLAPWICELLTALGVALLTRALTGIQAVSAPCARFSSSGRLASAAPTAVDTRDRFGRLPPLAVAAGAATWLAPPLMMNTGLFGQYDAFALAPAVFAMLAMLRGRWGRAGFCVGLGLLAKPQGLLMVPIVTFAALVAVPRSLPAASRRLGVIGVAVVATLVIGSAPWMLADGLAWVQRCYRMNLFEVLPYTTLEAFNVWYLLGLVSERQPGFDVLGSTTTVAGLTRDAWGRLFLVAALGATAALCWWRQRHRPELATVLFAGLALWSVFIWPTRVHERYILFCVPLMIVAATAVPRLRPIVAALLLIATMEHSWMIWRSGPPLGSFDRRTVERFHEERFQAYWRDRPVTIEGAKAGPKPEESLQLAFARQRADRQRSALLEWGLTLLSLGAYGAAVATIAVGAPATIAGDNDSTDAVIPSV